MAADFRRDEEGIALTEALIALPIVMGILFATVDVTTMLYEWTRANKAAYVGVRTAVVTAPVAWGITDFAYDTNPTHIGDLCFTLADGTADAAVDCPTVSTICVGGSANCTNGETLEGIPFNAIYMRMREIYPRLQPENVAIEYETNGLGFFGRPGGLPMQVTVRLRCMRTHLFFLGWAFNSTALPQGCPASNLQGPPLPDFSSTLPSEAMGA